LGKDFDFFPQEPTSGVDLLGTIFILQLFSNLILS
jgi:hypothetical protein